MSLEGELNITHVLRGKITSLGAINAPDKSLTIDGASADAKATGDALAKKADKAANGTVLSENADYAEIGWWLDGNPNNEDRTGYFVCIADDVHGTGMRKAKSVDDVRGVVVTEPAFAGNATADKFDENGQLLPKYDYVGIMGLVPVIDDGSCVVNERCMPNDEGIATASNNNLGYHVIERIDRRSILIAIEPNGDMVQRIKTEVDELQAKDEELQNKTEELQAKDEELESGKVDKEEGKALSTNDFTNEYKEKIDGIDAGANKYVLEEGSVTADKIADEAVRIRKTNVSVPASAFKANAGNEDYPYKAAITIDGADGNMKPDVTFGFAEVSSGIFAPIAESFNGGGGDTLVWDGNTEGLVSADFGMGFLLWKISDVVPTEADVAGSSSVTYSDNSTCEAVFMNDGGLLYQESEIGVGAFIIPEGLDGFSAGIYFPKMGEAFMSSLTIPGYTGFGGGGAGGVYIYASDIPETDITIPVIDLWR